MSDELVKRFQALCREGDCALVCVLSEQAALIKELVETMELFADGMYGRPAVKPARAALAKVKGKNDEPL